MKRKVKRIISTVLFCSMFFSVSINSNAYVTCNDVTITKDTDNNGNTIYTNKANGRVYTVNADGTTSGNKDYKIRSTPILSSENVEIGKYKEISVELPYGQTSISKLKVKKGKNIISAKICKKAVTRGLKLNAAKDESGEYYYLDRVTGERIYTGGKPYIYVDYADYSIRVFGKKSGKAVIQFQTNDSNGNKVETKKITANVTNNADVMQEATFAGKSLLYDYSKSGNNKKYLYYNGSSDGAQTTNKKSGKLKIKLNKNYKIKAIYLRKKNEYETNQYDSNSIYYGYYTQNKQLAVDLNGDGDCNDIIDGIEETSGSEYSYERVRNGQKIKLSSVPSVYDNTDQTRKDNGERLVVKNTSSEAVTQIIVIYQDKRTGAYYNWKKAIIKKVK